MWSAHSWEAYQVEPHKSHLSRLRTLVVGQTGSTVLAEHMRRRGETLTRLLS